MDFTLLEKNPDFRLEDYFQAIIDECLLVGRTVTIVKKEKRNFGKVESAFLKDNTDVYDLAFQTEKSLKIKIEVDTLPPLGFTTEQKMLDRPPRLHDPLRHASGPVCRQAACVDVSHLEESG